MKNVYYYFNRELKLAAQEGRQVYFWPSFLFLHVFNLDRQVVFSQDVDAMIAHPRTRIIAISEQHSQRAV